MGKPFKVGDIVRGSKLLEVDLEKNNKKEKILEMHLSNLRKSSFS